MTGWERSTSVGAGEAVRERVNSATRWRRVRALSDIPAQPPVDTVVARVRAGRRRRAYSPVLAAIGIYRELIARLNRDAIRSAIENHALVTRDDAVLLELHTAFVVMRALAAQGWEGREAGLVRGGRLLTAERGDDTLELYYQQPPAVLRGGSRYGEAQRNHLFANIGGLRPDLIAKVSSPATGMRWVLLEVKGVDRPVAESARAALFDLLAYRRAFGPTLARQPGTYGIGVAWGADLQPASQGEILLCSPDTLGVALERALSA